MKALIWILAVVSFLGVDAFGQTIRSQGLVLTGSVVSVTPRINYEASKPLVSYELNLYLQLRNDASVPLIFFRPTGDVVGRRVLFQDSFGPATETGEISLSSAPWIIPYTTGSPYAPKDVARYLNQYYEILAKGMELPYIPLPRGTVMILQPGEYYEYNEVVTVDDGFKIEIKTRQSLRDVARNTPIAEYPALRIEYKLSLKKHHPNDALLRMVQPKWKQIGHLVVDHHGDFSIQSDLILTRSGN